MILTILLVLFTSLLAPQTTPQVDEPAGPIRFVPVEPIASQFQFLRLRRDTLNPKYVGWKTWDVDYPSMDEHLVSMLDRVTAIDVYPIPIVARASAEDRIFDFPLVYMVEPESVSFSDSEIDVLREYLDRGGMIVMDDFHGDVEYSEVMSWITRVRPGARVWELSTDHELFHVFFDIDELVNTPFVGVVNWPQPWIAESGPNQRYPHVFAIYGQYGIEMILAQNTDLGDALEWADDPGYPEFYSAYAYRFFTNVVIYAMTH